MIKAIVFDAYGTLYDVYSVQNKCETVYPGYGEHITLLWRQKQLEYSWLRTLMERYVGFDAITKSALIFALEQCHLTYNQTTIDDIFASYLHLLPYPEVEQALAQFEPRKQVILSNGNAAMIQPLVLNTGLNRYISHCLSADDVKLYKPMREVYQQAVDYLALPKEQMLFVSSNGWDVSGAKSFGFQVGWVNRKKQATEQLDLQPDYMVNDLLQLVDAISDS